MTSCPDEVFSFAGRAAEFRGMIFIELGKGPRNSPLKTRTVKNESFSTSKRKMPGFDCLTLWCASFSWFKLRYMATLPLATIIFSRVPVSDWRLFCVYPVNKLSELSLERRRRNGNNATRIIFNIIKDMASLDLAGDEL